ncbi:MAG: hypothetical protein ABIS17_09835 [Casimicrobiaceae bacterium]
MNQFCIFAALPTLLALTCWFSPSTWAGINAWTTSGPRESWSFIEAEAAEQGRVFVSRPRSLYRSPDGGQSWAGVELPFRGSSCANQSVTALTRSATNLDTFYAATVGPVFTYCSEIARSTDGGVHWTPVPGHVGQGTPSGGAYFFRVEHVAGSAPKLYAGERYLWVSADDGATWRDITPVAGALRDFAVDRSGSGNLYALAASGLYKSVDGGANWTALATDLPAEFAPAAIAPDASDPRHVYLAGSNASGSMPVRLYESTDGGSTWTLRGTLPDGIPPGNVTARLAVAPDASNVMQFTISSGAWRSDDRGATWRPLLSPTGNKLVPAAMATANVVYAGDLGYGVMRSSDGARTFAPRSDWLPGAIVDQIRVGGVNAFHYFAILARGSNGVASRLAARDASTALWQDRTPPLSPLEGIGALATHPISGPTYVITGNRLQRTVDGGLTWEVLTERIASGIVDQLAIAPRRSDTLFAAGHFYPGVAGNAYSGALAVSTDGGRTWSDKSRNWQGGNNQIFLSIGAIAIDPQDAARLWAMELETLRMSDDGGDTWTMVHDFAREGATGYGVTISIDPHNSNEMVVFGQLGSRLYASHDAGVHWTSLGDSFDPAIPIRAIAVHWSAQPRVIYLGTDRGIYASTPEGQWALVPGSSSLSTNALALAAPAPTRNRTTLIAGTDSGVWEFTFDPAGQFVPIFRFYNEQTGAHFYTASAAERAFVLATYPQFLDEGTAFWALASPAPGAIPIYRFYNSRTGTHFYTADAAERAYIIATYLEFSPEGVAYYAFTESEPGTVGAYRFYNATTGAHFYTTAPDEDLFVRQHFPQFLPEGIRFGVYPAQPAR